MSNIFDNPGFKDMSYLLDEAASEDIIPQGTGNEQIIPAKLLIPFKGHPFEVNTEDDDFWELVESIKEGGLIYPILVRPCGTKYEIIAGHRRVEAYKAAGHTEVPVIVRILSDYEAVFIMVHSNLYRPEIKISERAKAFRMLRDAGKSQSANTGASIAKDYKISRRKVYRYIRLSYLSDVYLELIDKKKLSINVGMEFSYLDEDAQGILYEFLDEYKVTVSTEQAKELRSIFEKNSELTTEWISSVLLLPPKKKENAKVSFKKSELQEYFKPDTDEKFISNVIHQLLRKYKEGVLDQYIELEEDK